jgi:hypothetical protein
MRFGALVLGHCETANPTFVSTGSQHTNNSLKQLRHVIDRTPNMKKLKMIEMQLIMMKPNVA